MGMDCAWLRWPVAAAILRASEPNVALGVAADLNLEDHLQADVPDYAASFVLMDIFHPELAPASMDLVWNRSSLEEIPTPNELWQPWRGSPRPGGHVFVGLAIIWS